jgi:hypothetical protein
MIEERDKKGERHISQQRRSNKEEEEMALLPPQKIYEIPQNEETRIQSFVLTPVTPGYRPTGPAACQAMSSTLKNLMIEQAA